MNDIRGKITSNFLWRFLERFGAQGVGYIVSLVLARNLDPEVFGTVALVSAFTAVISIFVTGGFSDALIQKKDADELDFSTAFYCNLVLCVLMYGVSWVGAPILARFYGNPELTALTRALSLVLLTSGIKNIQCAYVARQMIFKRFFFATLTGTVTAAVVGIWMALNGFGAWALIVQNLVNTAMDTTILWFTVDWRPKKMFSWQRLKQLYAYGWKLLVSSLIDTVYGKLYQLVIGKKYTSDDLAFYSKGDTLPNLLVQNINTSVSNVLMPVMSAEQDDRDRVRDMTRKAIRICSFLIFPMMMGLAVCIEPFIRLVLTDKWIPTVPYMRIFCFTYAFYCVHTANLNAIKALGRSDLFLKLEILKKLVGILMLVITMPFGVITMAHGSIVSCLLSMLINAWPNRKLLGYSYLDQVKDMLPMFLLTTGMGIPVYLVQYLGLSDLLTLLIQVPLGAALYIAGAKLFRMEILNYALEIVRKLIPGRKTADTQ